MCNLCVVVSLCVVDGIYTFHCFYNYVRLYVCDCPVVVCCFVLLLIDTDPNSIYEVMSVYFFIEENYSHVCTCYTIFQFINVFITMFMIDMSLIT